MNQPHERIRHALEDLIFHELHRLVTQKHLPPQRFCSLPIDPASKHDLLCHYLAAAPVNLRHDPSKILRQHTLWCFEQTLILCPSNDPVITNTQQALRSYLAGTLSSVDLQIVHQQAYRTQDALEFQRALRAPYLAAYWAPSPPTFPSIPQRTLSVNWPVPKSPTLTNSP